MSNLQNNKIVIFGKSGSGKSYLTKKLIKKVSNRHLVIWDYVQEYKKGIIFYDYGLFINYLTECITEGKRAFVTLRMRKSFFPLVCQAVLELENVLFVIEEVDTVTSAKSVPEEFEDILRFGRHKNIHVIALSKRPADVPRLLTSQASEIYVFKTTEPRDLLYIKTYADIDSKEIFNLRSENWEHLHKTI